MKTKVLLAAILIGIAFLDGCKSKDDESASASITSIDPASGTSGVIVTINGRGFGATETDNVVKFNGVQASILSASATLIVVTAPGGGTTGPVTIEANGKTITGPAFTYNEPTVTETYYFSFKANGVTKIYQTGVSFYQSCGECACTAIPPLGDETAGLSLCNDDNNYIVGADIIGWKNKTYAFNTSGFPAPNFSYSESGVSYGVSYSSDQSGSVTITNVENDGTFGGVKNIYKVTGTFQGKVAPSGGGADIVITEGKFVINFSED